jgi:hypothetical protein
MPGFGLKIRTLAPLKERVVCAQSAVLAVPVPPHVSSVVMAPPSVTVPARPRTVTGKTLPLEMRTLIGLTVRNFTVRMPSEVSVRRQLLDSIGAGVYDHS